jgi:hypothetical protein
MHARVTTTLVRLGVPLCFTLAPTFAQIESGTLIVLYISDEKVVVAGDSLVAVKSLQGVGHENQYGCKIVALGKHMIFTGSGITGYHKRTPTDSVPHWSLIGEALAAYNELPGASADELSAHWAKKIRDILNLPSLRNAVETYARNNGGVVANGVFVESSTDDGFKVLRVQIEYQLHNAFSPVTSVTDTVSPEECSSAIGHYCAFGNTDVFTEYAFLASKRAKTEAAAWNRDKFPDDRADKDALLAIRLVELAIAYDKSRSVGGRVDAAILRRGRTVNWVSHPDCPAP